MKKPDSHRSNNLLGTFFNVLTLILFLFSPLVSAESKSDRFEQLFEGQLTIIDLTHSLSEDSIFWPGDSGNPFHYEVTVPHPDGSALMGAYSVPEHHGTHLDAPSHAKQGLRSVDQLLPKDLFGPAIVVDISDQSNQDPDYLLNVDDLEEWEGQYGRIPKGAIVLLFTGWSLKSDDPVAYANQDEEGTLHFPGFSPASAKWLLEHRDIRGIGIDNLSVDRGASDGYPVHNIVNGAGKIHLENVANLHLMPMIGANLIVAPTKIKGGSGGHVRIFAVLP